MMGKASGLPEVAIAPTASSVSENSSLANLPTASSKGPASAGTANAANKITLKTSVRRRSTNLAGTVRPRHIERRRRQHAALSGLADQTDRNPIQDRITVWRSRSLTAALVGLGVVVAALLANPVADQVLGTIKLLRPGVASH